MEISWERLKNIKEVKLDDLKPADYNPRHKSAHVLETVKQSLQDGTWLEPLVYNVHQCEKCGDRRMVIISGHRRVDAAKAIGATLAPAVEMDVHLLEEKRWNRILNAQERDEIQRLAVMIAEMHTADPESVRHIGFSAEQITNLLFQARYMGKDKISGILLEKFLIPPFSVLDAKQGYWQERKARWLDILGNLAETRESKLAGSENNLLMRGLNSGVSIFDPVLCEISYLWFSTEKGNVLDPFAGSLSRGGVAATLGYDYTGIEIRQEQIEANQKALARIEGLQKQPRYIHADAKDLNKVIAPEEKFDMIYTCPPYYDLEVYSEQEKDLSGKQSYEEFMRDYEAIFSQAVEHLKDNRFVVVVLGDIRDENGAYRDFLGDNVRMFRRLGLIHYNEAIYCQMLATAPHRAERNMRKRKVVKVHQNLYSFYKGDPSLLRNPQLLEVHAKVLTFLKGDPEAVQREFKNPPQIEREFGANRESSEE